LGASGRNLLRPVFEHRAYIVVFIESPPGFTVTRREQAMTKAELTAQVAEETGLTRAASKEVLDSILAQITRTLKKEGRFALFGLGIFEVVKRKKRIARNPRTAEPAVVKAHQAVKFKAAKSLKETLN
jgi:DNA-binding protein HU-beta